MIGFKHTLGIDAATWHLHVTLCNKNLNTHGGHALELRASATCEIVVRVIPGGVGRQMDETIGLNLFQFS